MTDTAAPRTLTAGAGMRYAAVILDLDGVVTDTATLHAAAWQTLFTQALPRLPGGDQVAPFDPHADYRHHVDGKARADGVRAFLASRGLTLPQGTLQDPPGALTVAGLAARKQVLFLQQLQRHGVAVFPSTVTLLKTLRGGGIRTALVTASRNASGILSAGGVAELFDTVVDGNDAASLGLAGKPDPEMFLEAARRLGVSPGEAVVIEDAEAGIRAAAAGGFALVVGVDRDGSRARLQAAGADVVLADLAALDLTSPTLDTGVWCGGADLSGGPWRLTYDGYDPAAEGIRETRLVPSFVATAAIAPYR